MYLRKLFVVIAVLLTIGYSCTDEDGPVSLPSLSVQGAQSVKPDSMVILEITATIPGLLEIDGLNGEVVNGEGELQRLSILGENSSSGSANFSFTAGKTESTTTLIKFEAKDQLGQVGTVEIEMDVTSLEITGVLVLNEGNFFSGNGTIDVFSIKENTNVTSVYQATATVQQMTKYQSNLYLVTNAPDRLDVLNESLELEGSIDQGLDNPVDFAAIGNQGFVSNWGDINTAFSDNPDAYIAIIDLVSFAVIDSVILDDRPQGLFAHQEKLFIANEGGSSVSVLDPSDLSLDEVTVPAGPSDIVLDNNGMLWVLCTSGSLIELDPISLSLGLEIDGLTTGGFNEKMAIDGTGNIIYFLGGSNTSFTGLTNVFKVDLFNQQVSPFIENGFALYGIGVNPESNELYIGDSNAFQSTGTGFRYGVNGNKLGEFPTGIGPRGFVFQ